MCIINISTQSGLRKKSEICEVGVYYYCHIKKNCYCIQRCGVLQSFSPKCYSGHFQRESITLFRKLN